MFRPSRPLATLLAAVLCCSTLAQPAMAQSISTEQAAAAVTPVLEEGRARLHAALNRTDLAEALQARGVSIEQLRARVDALTDAEAQQLLAQIDSAPAGADVLGLLFTLFIVLLVTDILGLTKVFPFTRPIR